MDAAQHALPANHPTESVRADPSTSLGAGPSATALGLLVVKRFDSKALYAALERQRKSRGLTWREAADEMINVVRRAREIATVNQD